MMTKILARQKYMTKDQQKNSAANGVKYNFCQCFVKLYVSIAFYIFDAEKQL